MHINRIYNKIKGIAHEHIIRNGFLPNNYFGKFPNFILMYHGINVGNNPYNSRHTSKEDFETQLKFLKKYCNVISVQDFFDNKFNNQKPNVAITFDDGLENNFINAYPLLEKYKTPATIYCTALNTTNYKYIWADYLNVATKFVQHEIEIDGEIFCYQNNNYFNKKTGIDIFTSIKNNHSTFDYKIKLYNAFKQKFDIEKVENAAQYWRLMTDEQIRKVSNSNLVTIGCHGFYHNSLAKIPVNDAVLEVKNAKQYLENIIQKPVSELAYPDSSYSKNLVNEALKIGFKFQLGVSVFDVQNKHILEKYSNNLKTRFGVYNCNSAILQILDAIKDLK